jgi:hypothetical protein
MWLKNLINSLEQDKVDGFVRTLEAIVRSFAGFMLVCVFSFSMFTVLYSLVWNIQPMQDMAPADKQFFEILKMMVAFLAGVITNMINKSSIPFTPMSSSMCQPGANSFSRPVSMPTSFGSNPSVPSNMASSMASSVNSFPKPTSPSPFANPNERPPL